MASSTIHIEPLDPKLDRAAFSCGVEALDRYFHAQAGQDSRRRIASCFVLTAEATIAGYYTLSATSVLLVDLPGAVAKKLPRYPLVPATLMGRLAVDLRFRGRRFGEMLLFDAFSRTLGSEIASFAFIVEAKDEIAERFYRHYEFRPLSDRRLFKPMAEVALLFA